MKRNKRKPREFKKPFIVLNRRKITGWIVAILFLCAWMFALGVLVGRDTAPVKFDIQRLMYDRDDSNTEARVKEQSPPTKDSVAVKEKTKLRFYEQLPEDQKDTSVPDLKPSQITESKKKEAQSHSQDSESKQKSQIKTADTEEATSSQTAAKQKDQKKAATTDAKQSTGVVYTIQAASVKKAQDADRLVAKLKQKGYPAYRTIGKVAQKGIWFRVRIGEYSSKAEARQTLNKLKKLGMKPILVKKQ